VEVPVPLVPLPPPDRYTDSAGIELRLIPAGTFTMPSVPPGPDRRVTITKPYYLGRTEVTRGQFRAFVEATGHVTAAEKKAGPGGEGYTPTGKTLITADPRFTWRDPGFPQSDDQPVVNVSWDDAKAFCDWLGKKEGKAYRLPTEAEWDFAAREGGQELLPFDAAPGEVVRHANVADAALRRRVLEDNPKLALPAAFAVAADDRHPFTAPVGRFEANRFGLADTFGNVSEWCLDWSGPTADLPTRDPVQTAEPKDRTRIARGGSFLNPGTPAALTGRYRYPSDRGNIQTGFRVCVEVGGGAAAAR
jgi:formylglycine-generating enzyme required for sulfatase activity